MYARGSYEPSANSGKEEHKTHSPPEGYVSVQADAEKKGYSGVAIWCNQVIESFPNISIDGMEWADGEGRCVGIKIAGLEVWSMYFPSGTSGAERQGFKDDFLTFLGCRKKYNPMLFYVVILILHIPLWISFMIRQIKTKQDIYLTNENG